MVLASLRGSAFVAVLFCAGATAQSLLILCDYLLQLRLHNGRRIWFPLGAVVALVILTVIFCLIYWVLKVIREKRRGLARSPIEDRINYNKQCDHQQREYR